MKFRFGSRLGAAAVASLGALLLLSFACGGDDDDNGGTSSTASPTKSAAASASATGGGEQELDIDMTDNKFSISELSVAPGTKLTINLVNKGSAIHAMRIAGEDNQYNNSDDAVSDPDLVTGGGTATLEWTAPAKTGTYNFQCDFHPTDMKGTVTVK